MHPILFQIGNFKVPSFGLMLVVAFYAGLWLAKKRGPRFGIEPAKVEACLLGMILAGILGARVLFIVQEWGYYSQHIDKLFQIQMEGLTSFGGLIGGLIFLILWSKKYGFSPATTMDLMAAPTFVGVAIGRVGCLLNGCCYGGPTDLPWGVRFGADVHASHPAQIYDSIFNLIGLAILLRAEKVGHLRRGQSVAIFLVLHGLARFIYEFWRAGVSSTYMGSLPITDAQAAALVLMIGGIAWFAIAARRALPVEVATA